jgi:chromate transport protein ChrA
MTNAQKYRALYILGVILCILPTVLCILCEFPLWVKKGNPTVASGVTLSAISLSLITIASTPLLRIVREKIKSPSMWMIWGFAFLVFYSLEAVISSLVLISFAGFIGNVMGAMVFFFAKKYKPKSESEGS